MLNNNGVARCVATENNNEPSCNSAPMTCDLQENCASITPSLCGAAWEDRCKTGVRNSEGEKACSLQQYGSVNQCEDMDCWNNKACHRVPSLCSSSTWRTQCTSILK